MVEPLHCAVLDRSQVGEARRRAAELAGRIGLGEVPRERVAVIVTELGTNLVKHAGGGELMVRALPGRSVIEVLAVDRGTGMADIQGSFRDGHSTAGSAGTGLGAVRRLASSLDVYSTSPGGTVIVARIAGGPRDLVGSGWDVGTVSVAKPGQEVCGDGWAWACRPDRVCCLMVVDGLGHGAGAADAARTAERLFYEETDRGPAAHVAALHRGLRVTRGAALAVARVDRRTGTLAFAGIGNVAGAILTTAGARQLVSMNGTVGHEVHRINEFNYAWSQGATLLMHTDGLGTRWDLNRYPGLLDRDPSLIAGVLFRDFNRGRDDVTVVVMRAAA